MGSRLLDTGVVIAWLDAEDAHHESVMRNLIRRETSSSFRVSAVTYAELRATKSKRHREAVDRWLELIGPSAILPVDKAVAETAGALRASRRSLKTADALIAATALESGAEELLTTDRILARLDGVTYVGAA